jgi:hypothetical protein
MSITWTDRGTADGFDAAFGTNAAARAVVDRAINDWQAVINDFGTGGATYNLSVKDGDIGSARGQTVVTGQALVNGADRLTVRAERGRRSRRGHADRPGGFHFYEGAHRSDLLNSGRTLTTVGRRQLISDMDASVLAAVYNYSVTMPSQIRSLVTQLVDAAHQLKVNTAINGIRWADDLVIDVSSTARPGDRVVQRPDVRRDGIADRGRLDRRRAGQRRPDDAQRRQRERHDLRWADRRPDRWRQGR